MAPSDEEDEGSEEESEDDEDVNPEEAGFMQGYERGDTTECANCGEEIEKETAVKKKLKGKLKYFCCDECREEFIEVLEDEEEEEG
ncbi:MAG: TRASH domain-containing protein [Candidatus Diapherotrites archaeon]|nr:TRASH domain-containing protein [Candidatus Diapherotrites archaeon]